MTLQGVENVTARHQRGIFATKGHIVVAVGRKSFRIRNEVSSKVYAQMLDTSSTYPVRFAQLEIRRLAGVRGVSSSELVRQLTREGIQRAKEAGELS